MNKRYLMDIYTSMSKVVFRKDLRGNMNDRDITITKTNEGLYIEIEGCLPYGTNPANNVSVQRSVVLIDTLYPEVTIKIWSHPDIEDYTHNVTIKDKD